MSAKDYKGNPRKGIWENDRFGKGIYYTNETLRSGVVKMMANFDPSKTGGSLRPRMPYFNATLRAEDSAPFALGRNAVQFKPFQDSEKEFIIDIGSTFKKTVIVTLGQISDVDVSIEGFGSGGASSFGGSNAGPGNELEGQ